MLIAVVNESTVVPAAAVQQMVSAIARQVRLAAAPQWGKSPVAVVYYPQLASVPIGADVLAVLDNADQAGALGYHDETPNGLPYGRIFAKTVLDNHGTLLSGSLSVSAVLSHEVIELFCDPNINLWADDGGSREIAVEACDPVEDGSYVITVNRVPVSVSNFVVPAYFDVQNTTGPWDHLGQLTGPWTMTSGGYLLTRSAGQVKQSFGDAVPEWKKEAKTFPAARTARRLVVLPPVPTS